MDRATIAARLRVAAAVNDPAVLANCLARSPDIAAGRLPLRTYADRPSAALAGNEALRDAGDDAILVLAHQDVYLPRGWADRLAAALAALSAVDPGWAIAGLFGKTAAGALAGQVWSTGTRGGELLRGTEPLPARVACLDELLLVVNARAGVRFDPALPGFHLYGVDVVQAALHAGRGAWAVDAPAVHHDKPLRRLDAGYRAAWRFARDKWRAALPIPTLIAPLERGPVPLLLTGLRLRRAARGTRERTAPASDPSPIAARLGWE